MDDLILYLGALAIVALGLWHSWRSIRRQEVRDRRQLAESKQRGLDQPMSLHPKIDPELCIGSGGCINACPEGRVIGLIEGCGRLVAGSHCIGHGLCAHACPVGAIKLVFGSAQRGVELPEVSGNFESSVKGLFIVGELGGMGLVANAFEQSIQAVDQIAATLKTGARGEAGEVVDLAIVGAGPAGLAAALRAKEKELSYRCLEQDQIGGAIRSYPRQKIVMTRPVRVPLFGPVKLRKTTKEALLELWEQIIEQTRVEITERTRVENIELDDDGIFTVTTSKGGYRARRVILAMGRRGTPRKLGVPGEQSTHVTNQLIEPERWTQTRAVVVGGGDSACEAALSLYEQPGTEIHLIHRGQLTRPRPELRERLLAAAESPRMTLLLDTQLERIEAEAVIVKRSGETLRIACDRVLISVGGVAPTAFLNKIGVSIITKFGDI